MIRDISGGILFFTFIIYAAWDLFAYRFGGADATLSGVIADWIATGRPSVVAAIFAGGYLFAHLWGWTKRSGCLHCPHCQKLRGN